MRNQVVAAIALILLCKLGVAADNSQAEACFYAVTVGATHVDPLCSDGDRRNLASNKSVQSAIKAFDLGSVKLRFEGCAAALFHVTPDGADGTHAYIVYYPSNTEDSALTAPTIHELGHVLQMEMNGGSSLALRAKYDSKRIELGADYLVGVLFARVLTDAKLNAFEQNLLLPGQYMDPPSTAHGTPAQRDAAFRNGVFGNASKSSADYRSLSDYFQGDLYAWVSIV